MIKIKSDVILKKIFAFSGTKIKFKIVKYNKKLKSVLNLKINDYKIFSGKYIVYEEKETGKEYDLYNNKLTFCGTYIKGEKNGYGKEFDDEYLIFEGNYKNGKRNGDGK